MSSVDFNGNGLPDECECLGDFTGDGTIGFEDVLYLLSNWGSPSADLNGNGICDQLEGEGCMDLMACNYSEFALVDDGSCDFSCCPGPGCCSSPNVWDPAIQMCVNTAASCGEGTVWDESLQQCLPEDMCFADLDNDGVVGMSDLLDLLARFGLECAD